MKKLDSLRATITAALPELARNPERLAVWIDRGAGRCRSTETEAFGFAYQANVLIIEMSADLAILALALFRWMRVNQPELITPGHDGFAFDADVLDNRNVDVQIQLQLTENVTVTPAEDGTDTLTYLPEPDPLFTDGLGLGGADPVPPLADLTFDEDLPPWNP